MKIIFFTTLTFLVTSCYTILPVLPNSYQYSENIKYKIDKVEEGERISDGRGGGIAPTKGNKFVFVFLTLTNESNNKEKIDLHGFYLLNKRSQTKHEVAEVMGTSGINTKHGQFVTLDRGKSKARKLVYVFPKTDRGELMLVNEEVITIKYLN